MSWLHKGEVFNDSKIPEGAVGFIYEMEAIIDGKAVRYIGKKNFYSITKKKLGVKALANMKDKRASKCTIQVKTNYQNYFSSNKVLQDAHKAGIPIKRFIVRICFSKTELTYHETKLQFVREVLEKKEYLKQNILGRFYKIK
jgi:hypothetical protein